MRGSAAFRAAVAPGGALAGPWVRNELWRRARAVPSLDLRFADNKSLVDATTGQNLVTFTRASSGTYVDSAGVIQTASTDVPRFDHNPTTGESLGLLVEEQRTNVVTWSQDFSQADWSKAASTIVATAVASPIQGVNYQKIEATSANTTIGITSVAIAAATQQRAVSFFAQPLGNISRVLVVIQGADARININLADGTATTNAAASGSTVSVSGQRFSVSTPTLTNATGVRFFLKRTGETDTNTPTTIAIGEGLYLTGAQMEAGFPTSYIPTTTAAVTRSADVASITGTAFSSWYRQDEGTNLIEFRETDRTGNRTPRSLSDGTASNRIDAFISSSLTVNNRIVTAGVSANPGSLTLAVAGSINKHALSVITGNAIASLNGTLSSTSSPVSLPVVDRLVVGADSVGGTPFTGTIRRLTYWPTRLANPTLQAITQ